MVMISDIEVWRSANVLLKTHGTNVDLVSAQRADELLAEGDVEGQLVWLRIIKAIKELQRITPTEHERQH